MFDRKCYTFDWESFCFVLYRLNRGEGGEGRGDKQSSLQAKLVVTNPWNKGLISADRNTRIALMLTIPRSLVKSSTKDLSFPIFEIVIQRTLPRQLEERQNAAIL